MSLVAKSNGSSVAPVEAGVHAAVCYGVIDLGTHHNEKFNKHEHKVLIQWEIPELRITVERDGKRLDMPRAISKKYTISLHEKSRLRQDLQSWRGRAFTEAELEGFDLCKVLGVPCLLNVIQSTSDGKTYANIAGIMPLPRAMDAAKFKAENQLVNFDIDNLAAGIPESLPDWQRKLIQESDEYKALSNPNGLATTSDVGDGDGNDEAPF